MICMAFPFALRVFGESAAVDIGSTILGPTDSGSGPGTTAALVEEPGEGHWLTRGGSLSHQPTALPCFCLTYSVFLLLFRSCSLPHLPSSSAFGPDSSQSLSFDFLRESLFQASTVHTQPASSEGATVGEKRRECRAISCRAFDGDCRRALPETHRTSRSRLASCH